MDGPAFLLFYAAVAAVLLGLCRWRNRAAPTRLTPLRELPAEPDPYEVAWLRGGGTEIVRLAVYDLLRCSYLAIEAKAAAVGRSRWIARIARALARGGDLALRAHDLGGVRRAACRPGTCSKADLPKRIDERCRALRTRFEEQGLVTRPAQRVQGTLMTLAVVAMLLVLGIWRIQASLAHGHHNVLFLAALMVISVAVAFLATMPPARLTSHGRAYLAGLVAGMPDARAAAAGGRANAAADATQDEPVSAGMPAAPALLGVALLGFPALAGTDYAVMDQLFPRAKAPADGSSCSTGSSCGTSSSCGSGSSGGSDGGGGGDGGGGCGGGCGGGGD